jgi:hypothetical protein
MSGSISGTAVMYRPNPGFVGEDQFTVKIPKDPTAFWHVGPQGEIHTIILVVN